MAQVAQISEELKADLITDTQATYATWKAGVTEEQKQAAVAMMEQFTNNPDFKAQRMARVNTIFAEADADGDQILNAAEWEVFHRKSDEDKAAEGSFVDNREGRGAAKYALLNRINPDVEGVTMADIFTAIAASHPIWEELRIADGL